MQSSERNMGDSGSMVRYAPAMCVARRLPLGYDEPSVSPLSRSWAGGRRRGCGADGVRGRAWAYLALELPESLALTIQLEHGELHARALAVTLEAAERLEPVRKRRRAPVDRPFHHCHRHLVGLIRGVHPARVGEHVGLEASGGQVRRGREAIEDVGRVALEAGTATSKKWLRLLRFWRRVWCAVGGRHTASWSLVVVSCAPQSPPACRRWETARPRIVGTRSLSPFRSPGGCGTARSLVEGVVSARGTVRT